MQRPQALPSSHCLTLIAAKFFLKGDANSRIEHANPLPFSTLSLYAVPSPWYLLASLSQDAAFWWKAVLI
jgi:hypothetical protein